MMKNMLLYRITNPGNAALLNDWQALHNKLVDHKAALPTGSQWRGIGFVEPAKPFCDEMVWSGHSSSCLFTVMFHERQLSSATINEYVQARVGKIEEREQRKCYRKEIAQIKDDVIATLMPKAFIKHSHVNMIVVGDLLIVGASTAKKAEDCLDQLRHATGSLAVRPLSFKQPAEQWLLDLARDDDMGILKRGDQAKLVDGYKNTAVFKGIDLGDDEPQAYMVENGFRPAELLVSFDENMTLRITDQLIFKAIKFTDLVINQSKQDSGGDPAAEQDGMLTIFLGAVTHLINHLIEQLGEDVGKVVTDQDLAELKSMADDYMDEHNATLVQPEDELEDEDF